MSAISFAALIAVPAGLILIACGVVALIELMAWMSGEER